MSTTALSGDQVLRQVYDPTNESLRTDIVANISGAQEVIINAADDSIKSWTQDGSGNPITSTGGKLDVNATFGGTVMTGVPDKTAFTYGTSSEQTVGGVFQDTSPALTAGQTGAVRLTQNRALQVNLRDNSGTEIVPATSALQTSGNASLASIDTKLTSPLAVTGPLTDAQLRASAVPISAASLPLPSGAATSANQTTEITAINTVNTTLGTPFQAGGNIGNTSFIATQATGTNLHTVVDSVSGTVAVSAASLPLPTGASTSALQTTGNTSLSSIDTKTPALGQALAAASVPVVLTAAQLSTLTPLSSVTVTQATGTNLHTVIDSGTITTITNSVAITAAALPLPSGAATSALQTSGNASLSSIDAKLTNPLPVSGTVTANAGSGTFAVSAATLPLPSGASTSALQTTGNSSLSSIDTKTPALGQALAAASVPVVLTAAQITTLTPLSSVTVNNGAAGSAVNIQDGGNSITVDGTVAISGTVPVSGTVAATQSGTWTVQPGNIANTTAWKVDGSAVTQPVSGTFFQATQPVSIAASVAVTGPLTDTQLRATPVPVSGTVTANAGSGTFAISAAALPLPSGAATAALQTQPGVDIGDVTVNNASGASAVNIQDGGNSITVDGTFFQATQPVSIAATVAISAASLPLPTGASTSALQTTGNTSLNSIDTKTPALGQALAAASVPVVLTAAQLTTLTPTVYDENYGTVGASTLRTAAQIGNATGAANFNNGATGAQTLRTAANLALGGADVTTSNPVPNKEVPDATATFAPTNITTSAYASNIVAKASSGVLFSVTGFNSGPAQFIQLHNTSSLPANGAVPVVIFYVPANGNFNFSADKFGRFHSTGIVFCNSSTGPTKTIGASDCWFDVQYQ